MTRQLSTILCASCGLVRIRPNRLNINICKTNTECSTKYKKEYRKHKRTEAQHKRERLEQHTTTPELALDAQNAPEEEQQTEEEQLVQKFLNDFKADERYIKTLQQYEQQNERDRIRGRPATHDTYSFMRNAPDRAKSAQCRGCRTKKRYDKDFEYGFCTNNDRCKRMYGKVRRAVMKRKEF